MLRVWTSPPSKVPAYSMSAPVVVNRNHLEWQHFHDKAARRTLILVHRREGPR